MVELLAMLKQGGWPMIPLGLCSLIAVAVIIERGMALTRRMVIHPHAVALVDRFTHTDSPEAALHAVTKIPGAFARIVEGVLRVRHLDHPQSMETMRAVGRTQVGRLERGLTVLEIIAGISPLIGLLGTVLGMVTVFNAITAQGLGNPQVLSEGISKALITTVAGLIVAIPALAFHSFFMKRVDALAIEMQDRATNFVVKLQQAER